tara:strand:- start:412 stop:627 length:216 start_codon:yes stop_codon:yes gene_type:complete
MEIKFIEVRDLANVLRLIDVAAKKGLFSGDQLATVGSMRERFNAELKEQAPAGGNVANISEEELQAEVSPE